MVKSTDELLPGPECRPDKQSLFVVTYHDGSRRFFRCRRSWRALTPRRPRRAPLRDRVSCGACGPFPRSQRNPDYGAQPSRRPLQRPRPPLLPSCRASRAGSPSWYERGIVILPRSAPQANQFRLHDLDTIGGHRVLPLHGCRTVARSRPDGSMHSLSLVMSGQQRRRPLGSARRAASGAPDARSRARSRPWRESTRSRSLRYAISQLSPCSFHSATA